MTIDRSLRLPAGQYYANALPKRAIVLHHTVGGSAKSSFDWWLADPRRVGTAFIIERDGTVFEVFPPEGWAGHLACHDLTLEQASIGIELASEGGLVERDGALWAFDGKNRLGGTDDLLERGRVVRFVGGYRGFEYFDAYEPAQMAAAIALTLELCDRFGLRRALTRDALAPSGDPRPFVGYQGVLHHACVRPDKSDLHPGFDYRALAEALGDAAWTAAA